MQTTVKIILEDYRATEQYVTEPAERARRLAEDALGIGRGVAIRYWRLSSSDRAKVDRLLQLDTLIRGQR